MPLKIPDNVTNPKTLRRYQRYKEQYDKWEKFAEENGYKVKNCGNSIHTFIKDGKESVLAFDSPDNVLQFIFNNQPAAETIFPPYNKSI